MQEKKINKKIYRERERERERKPFCEGELCKEWKKEQEIYSKLCK